jgi:hypothetical protein
MKVAVLLVFLLCSTLALPAICSTSGSSSGITLDIINNIPLGRDQEINANVGLADTKCYVTLYLRNITIDTFKPYRAADWSDSPQQCIFSVCNPKVKNEFVSDSQGYLREHVPLSTFKYVDGEEYSILVECGANCAMQSFNVTHLSLEGIEYPVWNLVWSLSNDSGKYIQALLLILFFIALVTTTWNVVKYTYNIVKGKTKS